MKRNRCTGTADHSVIAFKLDFNRDLVLGLAVYVCIYHMCVRHSLSVTLLYIIQGMHTYYSILIHINCCAKTGMFLNWGSLE